jgi:biopolymer transport protein ExbB
MNELVEQLQSYLQQGGAVMWPLVGATIALWFGLAYRLLILRRGSSMDVRALIETYSHSLERKPRGFVDLAAMTAVVVRANHSGNIRRYMDDELFELTSNMSRYRTLVRTIVLVAPLAGLLGTVMGMIEMFESLGDQTFFSQTGGVANGISQALFTTQFGLVIAIPGMIVGRLLDRREGRMREEIEQIKDLLSVQEEEEEPA